MDMLPIEMRGLLTEIGFLAILGSSTVNKFPKTSNSFRGFINTSLPVLLQGFSEKQTQNIHLQLILKFLNQITLTKTSHILTETELLAKQIAPETLPQESQVRILPGCAALKSQWGIPVDVFTSR